MRHRKNDPEPRLADVAASRAHVRRAAKTPAGARDRAAFEAAAGLERLKNAPNTMAGPDAVRAFLQMQRTIGNQSVAELVGAASPTVQRELYWDVRHQLTWKDFKAKVPRGAKFSAQTESGFKTGPLLQWKTVPVKFKDGNAWKFKVEAIVKSEVVDVKAVMDPSKSWVKHGKQTPDLLEHEQGHFDISHVLAEKLESKLNTARPADFDQFFISPKAAMKAAKSEYKQRLQDATAMFAKGKELSAQAQKDYDEDPAKGTDHGMKLKEQKQWEADITANLPSYDLP